MDRGRETSPAIEFQSLRRRSNEFRAASFPQKVMLGSSPSSPSRTWDRRRFLLVLGHGEWLTLGCVIAIPLGNLDDIVAWLRDHGLAAEPRIELLIGSHVHSIQFVVVRGADALLVLDPQMAGGASTDAATGMVEKDVEVLSDVEERHRLAMVIVGQGAEFKLDGLAFRHKRDPHELVSGDVRLGFFTHRASLSGLLKSGYLNSAGAMGCGAVTSSPSSSPAASMVLPRIAVVTAASIISSAKRRVA